MTNAASPPMAQTSWGPRFGVAYRPGRTTTLRASVDRYFQPPQLEWLLAHRPPDAELRLRHKAATHGAKLQRQIGE